MNSLIIKLFTDANAGAYTDKIGWFYPRKDSFLRKHGIFHGYDKQIIQKICYRCEGSGEYVSRCEGCRYEGDCWSCWHDEEDYDASTWQAENRCPRCGGTGFYMNRTYWLERYKLGDKVFHIPVRDESKLPFLMEPPGNIYTGKLAHADVDPARAERAMRLLFLWLDVALSVRYEWHRFRRNHLWKFWPPSRIWRREEEELF